MRPLVTHGLMLALSLAAAAFALPARAQELPATWGGVHDAIATWRLDSTKVAHVQSLLIERDAGSLVLEEGRVALAREMFGRRCALVFSGRGALAFSPRTEIERQQMRRFYGTPTLRRTFRSLAIVFTDSTLDEIAPALSFGRDTISQLHRAWLQVLPYLASRERGSSVVKLPEFAHALVDGDPGFFWAAAWEGHRQPVFLVIDPFAVERVQLRRTPEGEQRGLMRLYANEVVSRFRAAGDRDTTARDQRPPYEAVHYDVDVSLASDLRMTAQARVDVRGHGRPRHWLWFWISHGLRVDSVYAGGRALAFEQDKSGPYLWVRCEPPLAPDETRTLSFRYRGLVFEREAERIFVEETTGWYPTPQYGGDATWDLSFHWPRSYQLIASGERVSGDAGGAVHQGRWRVTRPVPWAAFDVSFLRGLQVTADSLPALTVWEHRVDGAGQLRTTSLAALADARSPGERIARDMARAAQFFMGEFGEPVQHSIHALEVPKVRDTGLYGPDYSVSYEAYPGLVHMMTPEDKVGTGVEWTPDFIRAHELAHQWWGLSVRPWSYHDQWLSEGFAHFCALWYLQAARQDAKTYLSTLDVWRDELLENRKFVLGVGQQAGPIWLGTRTSSSSTRGDYGLVIYKKGAWVLHMLRNMLLDLSTQDESRFRTLLRDFYHAHAQGYASTVDFERAAAAAAGEDLGWFFREWVYGTAAPTYRFTWSAVPAANGAWTVKGRVEQANVPDDFRMPVIVRVDVAGGRFARTRVWVDGPLTEFELPVAEKPVDVVFNDLQSVLAEVQKAK